MLFFLFDFRLRRKSAPRTDSEGQVSFGEPNLFRAAQNTTCYLQEQMNLLKKTNHFTFYFGLIHQFLIK